MNYQSEQHRKTTYKMLRAAGQEIMRGWHEEAGVPVEELDPYGAGNMPLEAPGDVAFLNDVARLMTGDTFPWHAGWRSEEIKAVREGMEDYVDSRS